jgi:hypothetical protein
MAGMQDGSTLFNEPYKDMSATISSIRRLSNTLYSIAETWVTGRLIRNTSCPYEQARIKMLFDYLFFYSLVLLPILGAVVYQHDWPNTLVTVSFISIFVLCAALMASGVSLAIAGTVAALNTLVIPMLSSFTNDLDVSPIYAIPWMMACLLGFFVINLRAALGLSSMLFLYLGLVALIKINHIPVLLPPTYSAMDKYVATPFLMAGYMVVCLRVWGVYYLNITRLEQKTRLEQQQQFTAMINQKLTKQFLLVKGLSRSGKTENMEGNTEMLDACFSEIEKQCDTAIQYLDGARPE